MAQGKPTPAPTPDDDAATATTPEDALVGVTAGLPDGEVTFTRPGIEAMTFNVKDGKISTTKERQDWLLRHVAGTSAAE